MNYFNKFVELLAKLDPAALPALGRMLGHLIGGRPDAAAREARFVAETIGAKQAIRAPYRARGK